VWNSAVGAAINETDLLLPNEQELILLTGTTGTDAALDLLDSGPAVAVKLGSSGALLQAGGRRWRAPAAPVATVDTTGAGDCFDAGAIYGLLAGWEPERQLALAVACGSLSTRGVGGTGAQPSYAEAADVAARIAVREL
jgi:sugar/nucleoside kinase (ribokinase family)